MAVQGRSGLRPRNPPAKDNDGAAIKKPEVKGDQRAVFSAKKPAAKDKRQAAAGAEKAAVKNKGKGRRKLKSKPQPEPEPESGTAAELEVEKSRSELLPPIKRPDQHLNLDSYEEDVLSWFKPAVLSLSSYVSALYAVSRVELANPQSVQDFLRSEPGLEDDEHATWELRRFFGAGSHGRVGCWMKVDTKTGHKVDEIAIKEVDEIEEANPTRFNHLPSEVVVNRDLNTYNATHVSYLRAYKYGQVTKKGRMYMRAYEHGDIEGVINLYRIYGWFLPEWFVLTSLLDLCSASDALAAAPPADTKFDRWSGSGVRKPKHEELQTIHLDLKPQNVFLDEPPTDEGEPASMEAPRTVMADFGNADYTSINDSQNPKQFACAGTGGYHAPESRNGMWLWYKDLIREDISAETATATMADKGACTRKQKKLDATAHNIYGVGRVIFDLMMPMGRFDFGRLLRFNEGQTEPKDYKNAFSDYYVASLPLPESASEMARILGVFAGMTAQAVFPYSDGLVSLLSRMLHPSPSDRPTLLELRQVASELLAEALKANKEEEDEKRSVSQEDRIPWSIDPHRFGRLLFRAEDFVELEEGDNFPAKHEAMFQETHGELFVRANTVRDTWPPDAPLPMKPRWYTETDCQKWWRFEPSMLGLRRDSNRGSDLNSDDAGDPAKAPRDLKIVTFWDGKEHAAEVKRAMVKIGEEEQGRKRKRDFIDLTHSDESVQRGDQNHARHRRQQQQQQQDGQKNEIKRVKMPANPNLPKQKTKTKTTMMATAADEEPPPPQKSGRLLRPRHLHQHMGN